MVFRKAEIPARRDKRVGSNRPSSIPPKRERVSEPPVEQFVIREAMPKDLEELERLASFLNSVNLPANKEVLRTKIKASRDSFATKIENPLAREYLFVMEGVDSGRLAGTSMLFAQHGTNQAPHIYFDVLRDERYSMTLG